MGELIRLLLVALAIWLVWRTLTQKARLRDASSASHPTNHQSPTQHNDTMVRCARCGVHLPPADAFHYRNLNFCCQQHQAEFLQQQETQP